MKKNLRLFLAEWKIFASAWRKYLVTGLYGWFSGFEKAKGGIAHVLYRQRGRFARPFVHSAMAGLMAMAVTLAPVLASSLPGVQDNLAQEVIEANQVLVIQTDNTATQVSDKVRDKIVEYEVKPGDTVSAIAEKFGVSKDPIRWENNLASVNAIKPGQVLKVLPVTGVKHKVARGETIYSVAKKYGANPQAVVDFPFNTFADNETFSLAIGQDLIVPDGEKPNEVLWSPSRYVAATTPNAGAVSATGSFVWPIGGKITQRFAWYHRGLDIATSLGTPVLAADAGTVTAAGWPDNSGYGNRVVINHNNGYTTLYAHLSKVSVVAGQTVKRGDVVGLEGSTGRSTGPHLHFEIRRGGVLVNPLEYLK